MPLGRLSDHNIDHDTPWVAVCRSESKSKSMHARLIMFVRVSKRLSIQPESRKTMKTLYYGHYAIAMNVKMSKITNNTNAIVVFDSVDELTIEESTARSDVGVVADGLMDDI